MYIFSKGTREYVEAILDQLRLGRVFRDYFTKEDLVIIKGEFFKDL